MSGTILAFVAVLLAGLGARDQMTIASVTRLAGQRAVILLAGVIVSLVTAGFAGWAASVIAPTLNTHARLLLAALSLGLAGIEALALSPGRDAREPTHSVGALLAVLTVHQLTDAARFLIFGIGLAAQPLPAALGGAAGGMALIAAAWAAPDQFTWHRLRRPRRMIGFILLLLSIYLGLSAMRQI